jgi:hypothetical protein
MGWWLAACRVDRRQPGDPDEKMTSPFDDVEMATCDGVEAAGIGRMLPQPALVGQIGHRPRLPPAAWMTVLAKGRQARPACVV